MAKEKPRAVVLERPSESIIIQIHEKRRGRQGTLAFKRSKSITVYNLTLDEVHERILTALKSAKG